MTIENERTLEGLTANLLAITAQLEELMRAGSLPSELESRVDKSKGMLYSPPCIIIF